MIDWHQRSWQRTEQFSYLRQNLCVLRFSTVCGKDESKSHKRMEGENRMVYEFIPMSRIGSNRRRADGVRVGKFPRTHHITTSRRDPEK